MAAPEGNTNRATQYRIKRTLEAVLDRRSRAEGRDALEAACEAMLTKAEDGDVSAFREIADRLDGKPTQTTALTGPDGGSVKGEILVKFVGTASGSV